MDLLAPNYILLAIHLVLGFLLVYYAIRAYKKTKFPPMILLAIGFSLLVIGETVVGDAFSFVNDPQIQKYAEQSFEIGGFITLILAVKKS